MTDSSQSRALHGIFNRLFLPANQRLWGLLPPSAATSGPALAYGQFLHSLVQKYSSRTQYYGTYFLRNRPELTLLRRLASKMASRGKVTIAVLGCSNGAEVYSIAWAIRSSCPDLELTVHAADISPEILEIARAGVYSVGRNELMDAPIFERLTREEMSDIFDVSEQGQVRVKPWIREGIDFQIADAGDPEIVSRMGTAPIVVANRFLCHMAPAEAESCLRNLARLVQPGGFLFVSGVDLEVRTKVARDLNWVPVQEDIEELHNGDPSVRGDWPWKWWGLEPFNQRAPDWKVRYASAFRIGEAA